MQQVFLRKGREQSVLRGHPWIFSGAIESEGDRHEAGLADVFDHQKRWLARGFYSPKSQIRVRVLTREDQPINADFFRQRVARAFAFREKQVAPITNAYRLINAEGDFLPGLIVDRYAGILVCQFFTAGADALKDVIAQVLWDVVSPVTVFEKSAGRVRDEEGLPPAAGVLAGEPLPECISVTENGHKFLVDVWHGQKTGFFLDQRDNRASVASLVTRQTVLNCFCYTGGFSVYAYSGGAKRVVSLDSSRPALELAEETLTLNNFPADEERLIKADAFSYLKEATSTFDVIILDPPSLAHKRSDVQPAAGGYKFLNLHALRLVKPGGLLVTFSCSPHISTDLFQKIVFGAALDAGRDVAIVKRLGHAIDHPVSIYHPEGEYLKGFALRVLN